MSEGTEAAQKQTLKLIACGRTDTGQRRPQNEDSIEVSESLGLFAVADGMGGHAAGEVASRTAIETLHSFTAYASVDRDFTWPFGMNPAFSFSENMLLTAIHLANRKICQLAGENPHYAGMGTTLAVLFAYGEHIHIAHVGDSRVYRLRDGRFEALTMDHSWVNEQLQRHIITEDEARTHRWRNVITRALGNRPELEVDMKTIDRAPGDLFLLCSDGLTGMLRDEEITEVLMRGAVDGDDGALDTACAELVEMANAAGGLDNISVVLVRVLA